MAYTVDIKDQKQTGVEALLSKIKIGDKVYGIKDLIARESIGTLSAGLDAVSADLLKKIEDLSYVEYTNLFADDVAIKNYVDSQVGAINKFDVRVLGQGEKLPDASASTMYILYLVPETDAASGTYVEYITIRSGEEGAYDYEWEAIGSTKMDVTGFVTSEALNDVIEPINERLEQLGDLANKNEADLNLKALAHKDSAAGVVPGQTISGVKANGTTTGSIKVELEQSEHAMNSTGKFTPAGNVTGTVQTAGSIAVTAKYAAADATLTKGDYTPAGTVSADFTHAATAATLTKADYTPAGEVSVTLSGNTFNAITGVGTQAQFTDGVYTPAELVTKDITIAAHNHLEAAVNDADELLTFTAPMVEALTFKAVDSFSKGDMGKATFVPNSLPTMAEQSVGVQSAAFTGTKATEALVTGVSYDKAALANLAFAGTKAEGALVTGVSYQKADIDAATFTGQTVDIAATFAGTEGDLAVAGTCHDYAVKTAEFNGAAIELNVGDIVVSEKNVTVE